MNFAPRMRPRTTVTTTQGQNPRKNSGEASRAARRKPPITALSDKACVCLKAPTLAWQCGHKYPDSGRGIPQCGQSSDIGSFSFDLRSPLDLIWVDYHHDLM